MRFVLLVDDFLNTRIATPAVRPPTIPLLVIAPLFCCAIKFTVISFWKAFADKWLMAVFDFPKHCRAAAARNGQARV